MFLVLLGHLEDQEIQADRLDLVVLVDPVVLEDLVLHDHLAVHPVLDCLVHLNILNETLQNLYVLYNISSVQQNVIFFICVSDKTMVLIYGYIKRLKIEIPCNQK